LITVPISIGELIDKLSILYVKKTKISNIDKLNYINKEFELLYNFSSVFLNDDEILKLYHELVDTNSKLWDIEDNLRVIENEKNFDSTFIELSRSVYITNDKRFKLKDKINTLTNSDVREQKDYVNYR
jgi:alpha-glucuronidase